jgi:small subunit ribosomal protein S9
MVQKVIHISGTRKKAIARATLREGKGYVRMNKQLLSTIEPELVRLRIQEPLQLAKEYADKVNIDISVKGGGFQAQAEAARLAIARALLQYSKNNKQLKQDFLEYDRHLVVADVRTTEQNKPNDSKARAKRQKSYR